MTKRNLTSGLAPMETAKPSGPAILRPRAKFKGGRKQRVAYDMDAANHQTLKRFAVDNNTSVTAVIDAALAAFFAENVEYSFNLPAHVGEQEEKDA